MPNGLWLFQHTAARRRLACVGSRSHASFSFNTQPPEGGWPFNHDFRAVYSGFQHTAARRRLVPALGYRLGVTKVSTHSRPKAAGLPIRPTNPCARVSTHSRPKAAGLPAGNNRGRNSVSTHSRPKAAGGKFQNARHPETFQHTAARRRLAPNNSIRA